VSRINDNLTIEKCKFFFIKRKAFLSSQAPNLASLPA
jgi:hypothetical protein